jgi:hypothetical protein
VVTSLPLNRIERGSRRRAGRLVGHDVPDDPANLMISLGFPASSAAA